MNKLLIEQVNKLTTEFKIKKNIKDFSELYFYDFIAINESDLYLYKRLVSKTDAVVRVHQQQRKIKNDNIYFLSDTSKTNSYRVMIHKELLEIIKPIILKYSKPSFKSNYQNARRITKPLINDFAKKNELELQEARDILIHNYLTSLWGVKNRYETLKKRIDNGGDRISYYRKIFNKKFNCKNGENYV